MIVMKFAAAPSQRAHRESQESSPPSRTIAVVVFSAPGQHRRARPRRPRGGQGNSEADVVIERARNRAELGCRDDLLRAPLQRADDLLRGIRLVRSSHAPARLRVELGERWSARPRRLLQPQRPRGQEYDAWELGFVTNSDFARRAARDLRARARAHFERWPGLVPVRHRFGARRRTATSRPWAATAAIARNLVRRGSGRARSSLSDTDG